MATAALALGLAAAPGAGAQESPLGLLAADSVRPAARVQLFSSPDGQVRFILDRTPRSYALMQVLGDDEVYVMRPLPAASGDEVYATDDRGLVIRVRPNGAVTVYTRVHRDGTPVSRDGAAAPIAPEPMAQVALQQRLAQLQITVRRSVGRPIAIEAPPSQGPDAFLVLDAATRAAQALSQTPQVPVQRIVILLGPAPMAQVQGQTLIITVAPGMGFAGRPSTAAVRTVVAPAPR